MIAVGRHDTLELPDMTVAMAAPWLVPAQPRRPRVAAGQCGCLSKPPQRTGNDCSDALGGTQAAPAWAHGVTQTETLIMRPCKLIVLRNVFVSRLASRSVVAGLVVSKREGSISMKRLTSAQMQPCCDTSAAILKDVDWAPPCALALRLSAFVACPVWCQLGKCAEYRKRALLDLLVRV
jgi:hypothetical protein